MLDLKANPESRARSAPSSRRSSIRARVRSRPCSCRTARSSVGDDFICGMYSGRVRALLDERGKPVKAAGPGDSGAGARPAGRADGRRPVPRRRGRDAGARDRAAPRASRSRGEEPPHDASGVGVARRLHVADGGRRERARCASSSRPTRAVRRKRSPTRWGSCRTPKCRWRSCTAASARSPRATSCSPRRRARSSSASTCARTTTRARRPSAKASTSSCTASSTRPWPTWSGARRHAAAGGARGHPRRGRGARDFKVSRIGTIAGCIVRSGIINRQGTRARHSRRRRGVRRHASRRCAASRTT